MANRFILNETSYHGAGAIAAIADEAKAIGIIENLDFSDVRSLEDITALYESLI